MLTNIPRTDFASREEWLEDRIKTYEGSTLRAWAEFSATSLHLFLHTLLRVSRKIPYTDEVQSFVSNHAPHYNDEFDGKR